MPDEQYVGYDTVPTEGYQQPDRYKVSFRCLRCGHEYSRIQRSLSGPDAPCPKKVCKDATLEAEITRRVANAAAILEAGEFPGITGTKPLVKAIDATAQIVMEDHGMTNLADNLREGDTMRPKLPQAQQDAADNFFSAGAASKRNPLNEAQRKRFGQRAMAGAYNATAVAPGDVFRAEKGAPALRHVRTERG